MSDLHERLKAASEHVAPEWTPERSKRLARGIDARRARQATVRRVGGAAATVAVLVFTLAYGSRVAEAATALTRWLHALVVTTEPTPPAPAVTAPATTVAAPSAPAAHAPVAALDEPVAPPPVESVPVDPPKAPSTTTTAVAAKSATAPARDWRALAREQDYARAYEAMRAEPQPVRDEAEDLLLASDVARLSKHGDEAIAPLQKILREHRSDPRASLAAFTLGRVLLEQKRASEAADAFADARKIDPKGSIAEDALAREAEAASVAGDQARARRAAEAYLATYPNGTRAVLVRRFGNLDER